MIVTMRFKLLVIFLPFVVNAVKAVLLAQNSNVEAQRNVAAIFSERRPIQTIYGGPTPIMIKNLDVRKTSTEFTENRPIDYNVVPVAESATSEILTDEPLIDNSAPAPKPVEDVEGPESIPIPASEPIADPEATTSWATRPASGATSDNRKDANKLLSYKYPIYYRNPDLKDYVCADEYYYNAVVNQCDHFIECKKNEVMEFICPDGLHFNPEAKWQEYPCADPSVVVCKTEITTKPTPPIEVPETLPHYKCPEENNYYATEDQCTTFIECKQNSAMKFSCPDDLLFDPEAKWPKYPCNDASVVRCGLKPEPQPIPRPTPPPPRPIPPPRPVPNPTTRPPYVPVPITHTPRPLPYQPTLAPRPTPPRPEPTITYDYRCIEKNNYYSLPHDCSSFIECKNFVAMKYMCPDGLQFDPQAIWPGYPCAEASYVKCLIPTVQPPTTTPHPRPKPVTPEPKVEPEIVDNYICAEENRYYSIKHDCESYIECRRNIPYGWKCPNGWHFNINAKYPHYACASPSVAKCGKRPDKEEVHPDHGCPHENGYFALQDGDCSRYLMCLNGQPQIMDCPAGLAFNDEKSSCDWPENVPSCNPTVFQGFSCPAPDLNEHGQPDDTITKYRYGTRCKEYLACQRGYPRLLSCDVGLSFDNESKACIDSEYVTNCV